MHDRAVYVQVYPDRYALNNFDEVACGVIGRKQREFGAGCTAEGFNGSLNVLIGEGVYRDVYLLAQFQVIHLGFFEVGGDV